jgi:copper(I)-binding protein
MWNNRRTLGIVAALVGLVLIAAACSDDSSDDGVTIENQWSRPSPMMADAGAVYLDITSSADDTLVAASVSADLAAVVEIHETVAMDMGDSDMAEGEMSDGDMSEGEMSEGEMSDGHDMGDMPMMMQELDGGLVLPKDKTVNLEPGGYHIMMLGLVEPLELGDTFELTLEFDNAESQVVEVEVRETAP